MRKDGFFSPTKLKATHDRRVKRLLHYRGNVTACCEKRRRAIRQELVPGGGLEPHTVASGGF